MKRKLYFLVPFCTVLLSISLIAGIAWAQSTQAPDTKILGVVKEIQTDYQGYFLGGTYKLTAFISVLITEVPVKPEAFTRETDQLVGVSYNYSVLPDCKVNDSVEVSGLWVQLLDVPMSQTIRVDQNVEGSYVVDLQTASSAQTASAIDSASTSIDTGREYSNGTIDNELWYDWINANGTQVIFLAYFSNVYNSPVITFLGQHYKVDNETEVFMGNTLMLLEAYNDTNNNGVPDFTPSGSELQYNFIMNSSVGFSVTPIQKSVIDNVTHYTWGVEYQTIDGFFLFPEDRQVDNVTTNVAARAMISHIGFSYDYYIQGNTSYLKSSFDIGRITDLQPSLPTLDVSLDGLSLSLFFGTSTLSSKPYVVEVNGQPYNSTVVTEPTIPNNQTEVKIQDKKAYEFLFGQNYTLFTDSSTEAYQSKSIASSKDSVPTSPRVSLTWVFNNLQSVLNDLFPQITTLPPNLNLDYETSTLLYRICYPTWNGYRIKHDPTYIAYFYPTADLYTNIIGPPLAFVAAVALVGAVALAAALVELRKTRHTSRIPPIIHT
jgi:hypothetical protein